MHNKRDNPLREPKVSKTSLKKSLVNIVIGFLKVYLENHIPLLLLLRFMHLVYNFLQNNSIINSTSLRKETALQRAYNGVQHRLNPSNKGLRNDLVDSIAKTYRSELLEISWAIHLGYQCNKSFC